MPTSSFVVIPKKVHSTITDWANQAYPHEGCGLLIGRFAKGGGKEVARLAPLNNLATKAENAKDIRFETLPEDRRAHGGSTEFVMDPAEFNRETLKAEKEGLDVVGVIHTHPDHPARPSLIDSSQPLLSQWSNIIVSVMKGKTAKMASWFREKDGTPFEEEEIRIQ